MSPSERDAPPGRLYKRGRRKACSGRRGQLPPPTLTEQCSALTKKSPPRRFFDIIKKIRFLLIKTKMKNCFPKIKQAAENRVDNLDLTGFFGYATLKLLKPPTLILRNTVGLFIYQE